MTVENQRKIGLPVTIRPIQNVSGAESFIRECPVPGCKVTRRVIGKHYKKEHLRHWKEHLEIQNQVFQLARMLGWRLKDVDEAIGAQNGYFASYCSRQDVLPVAFIQQNLRVLRDLLVEESKAKDLVKPKHVRKNDRKAHDLMVRMEQRELQLKWLIGVLFVGTMIGMAIVLMLLLGLPHVS